jgi:hypothetical protein
MVVVLYCPVLYCAMLYCTALCDAVLYCTALCDAVLYGAVRAVRSYFLSPLILRSVQDFTSTFSQLEEERAQHSAKKFKAMEEHMELVRNDILQRREESKLLNRHIQLQSKLLMALLQREGGVSVANRLADDCPLLSNSDDDD